MTANAPRLLILGVDGADPRIIENLRQQGRLPHLDTLIRRGCLRDLPSTVPPTTLPAWTSFLTGKTPAGHGVTDFTIRKGYRVSFVQSALHRTDNLFSHLERHGLRVGAAWFPATWPPLPLSGWHISGWDSPVSTHGDASFVHPPKLHRELTERFTECHLAFDAIDEFSDSPNWYDTARERLLQRIADRARMARWLLEHQPVDVAAFYFGETDTAAHHFYAFHDPASPRRPQTVTPSLAKTLSDVYVAVDTALGSLLSAVSPDTQVVILSDHGSVGNADIAVHLNRFLENAGLLSFRSVPGWQDLSTDRNALVRHIPPLYRRRLFRLFGGLFPSLYESMRRFRHIDFSHTAAFSEELPYAPSIWINQRGREPRGTVRFRDRDTLRARIEDAANHLRHEDGTPVISRIHPRETLDDGPYLHQIPDFVLEFTPVNGFQPVCRPSGSKPGPPLSRIPQSEHLGRKGTSMPGGHGPTGIFVCSRPNIPAPPGLHHIAAAICQLLDIPSMTGATPAPSPNCPVGYTSAEQQIVASRLRRLGYLEE